MDLGKIEQNDTAELILAHPLTGEKTDIKICIMSPDTKQGRKARSVFVRQISLAKENVEVAFNAATDFLVENTVSWENVQENGKPIKFTQKKAKELYEKHSWIRSQVDIFLSENNNFLTVT